MQLRLPWSPVPPRRRSPLRVVNAGGRDFPVEVARHSRARRYVMRLTADGAVRLTVPRGASVAGGLAFVATQGAWIEAEWARRIARTSWDTGTVVWFRGQQHGLDCHADRIDCGALSVPRRARQADVRSVLQAHWRALAASELPERCMALAGVHGFTPSRVTVRDQRSCWGSCSSRGSIALNWRLIQMPSEVADYVMLHELVHLAHPNHGQRFWRGVAGVCDGWRAAERWLRTFGRDLL